jgi:colanic acid/amylovoran biosynthesis glycosyltransferase
VVGESRFTNIQTINNDIMSSANGNCWIKNDEKWPVSFNGNNKIKVAYITSRFPKITETFILYEMLAVKKQGVQIELYPFIRERTDLIHPEANQFVDQAHFQPFISWPILRSHLFYLHQKPRTYLDALWKILSKNWGSLRFFSRALAVFPVSVYLSKLMEAEGIQHIHAHFSDHPAAAGYVIHRLTDIPFSFTAHGSDLHRDRHMLCEKTAEADFVVTISEYNKKIILSECGEENIDKVIVVHCGVDTEFFKPRPEYSPCPDETESKENMTIMCIGTLHEVKGQTYLIEACKILRERGVNFTCHFVGDGPDWRCLTQQVTGAGLEDQVKFHGRLTRDEVVRLLRMADVLVAPSVRSKDGRREGIPVVLMEAMSSGLAVVASDISGIPELIESGKTGLLVPPRDEQSLAGALRCLYFNKPLRRGLGEAARLRVIQDFQLDRNASTLVELFKKSARRAIEQNSRQE